jgi:hypothetical protein
MRTLLVILLLLVVCVVGLGFYLGWFSLSTSRDPNTGRSGVNLTIDQDKMKGDVKKAKEKVTGGGDSAKAQPDQK